MGAHSELESHASCGGTDKTGMALTRPVCANCEVVFCVWNAWWPPLQDSEVFCSIESSEYISDLWKKTSTAPRHHLELFEEVSLEKARLHRFFARLHVIVAMLSIFLCLTLFSPCTSSIHPLFLS